MSSLSSVPFPRHSRNSVPDVPATGSLAGWRTRSSNPRIQLARCLINDRPYLAVLIAEPLDGVEIAITRRFTRDMGASYEIIEPEDAA